VSVDELLQTRSRSEALAREEHWARPVALATLLAVILTIVGSILLAQAIGGSDGDAELLRQIDQHRGDQIASSVLQALGTLLLAAPLLYLFRADQARSPRVHGQLVGLVVAAPVFLAVYNALVGVSALDAATDFIAQGVTGSGDRADKIAEEAIEGAPLQVPAAIFGFAGRLGFMIAMFYTCLYGLRTGLLTRFWGSLGMALGAVSFLFPQFALLWFLYLGLLIAGWIPGGRPPAWAAGEAIPPPTPGERVAKELEPEDDQERDETEQSR
jgi:hypothetical protein